MKTGYQTIELDRILPARITLNSALEEPCRDSHWHKEIELIYVLAGRIRVRVNEQLHTLSRGGVILINSSELHRLDEGKDSPPEYLSVHLSFEFAQKFDNQLETTAFFVEDDAVAELRKTMHKLALVKRCGGADAAVFREYALLMDVFYVLFARCRREKQINCCGNTKNGERKAKIAIAYMEDHYRESISLNVVAELVGLNPVYFSKYFKDVTQTGFIVFLNTIRMKHALEDMVIHGMSSADAAKCNGFSSVKSFENICKRSYGLTPLQFKKQQLRVS